MGNEIEIDKKKETILWIDANIYNGENKITYKNYLQKFKNFNFICFESVKKAMNFINDNHYFDFRLIYVIVSGRLAENFFNEYVKIIENKCFLAATTVYCFNQALHEKKPYFKDKFLNPGGITYNFKDVYSYILKDECQWAKTTEKYKGYEETKKEKYGNKFVNINTKIEYELALPILIGKLINSSLLEKDEISKFQELLLRRYCKTNGELNYLIKPSGNKNIDVPIHLLAKYFLRLYTKQTPFYGDLNKDLTNGKFDDYHPFIFLLYDALNKENLRPYKQNCLYRGDKLSIEEFEEMKKAFENSKKNKSIKALFYSKNFLSFSKNKKVSLGVVLQYYMKFKSQKIKNFL